MAQNPRRREGARIAPDGGSRPTFGQPLPLVGSRFPALAAQPSRVASRLRLSIVAAETAVRAQTVPFELYRAWRGEMRSPASSFLRSLHIK
jgi:hypothetical protein